MFALVDCNNFYVSCERLFRPDLQYTPVAVLSNNDGCVVARSNEVKAMGIKMGVPYFQVKKQLQRANAHIFSSNYRLYGDISQRVMDCTASMATDIEVYSIDEAFLCLKGLRQQDWVSYGFAIQQRVMKDVGIPVSVGLAPTKTMAKLANHIGKKNILQNDFPSPPGIFALDSQQKMHRAYETISIDNVWGIGRRYTKKLNHKGIETIGELLRHSDGQIRTWMTVMGLTTCRELQGIPCLDMETIIPKRKSIVFSRSFGTYVSNHQHLYAIVAHYASKLGARLRKNQRRTSLIHLFLQPPFVQGKRSKSIGMSMQIPQPTADTSELIRCSRILLERMLRRSETTSLTWKKAGILALELSPLNERQIPLFASFDDQLRGEKISDLMDGINARWGQDTIRIAATIGSATRGRRNHLMKRNLCSPNYTTKWSDILTVKI